MGKLSNAPLLETVFEIKWDSRSKTDIDNFQLLIGEMYTELGNEYEKPISMIPDPSMPVAAFVNIPIYRFIKKNQTTIFQIGPGILSVNCIDKLYSWKEFFPEISRVITAFKSLFQFSDLTKDTEMSLRYIDFFDVDIHSSNLYEYLEDKLHLKIQSELLQKPQTFGFNTSYLINDSLFNLSIFTGKLNANNKDGLIIETKMSIKKKAGSLYDNWEALLNSYHTELNTFFDRLIEGELYNRFK